MTEHTLDGRLVRGLTLWRPWPWAFLHADKPVENRTWAPPAWMIGGWVALHAGKHFDTDAANSMANGYFGDAAKAVPIEPATHPHSVIVAVAPLVGCKGRPARLACPWSFGPKCWLLPPERLHPLALPVPCRGARGLWRLPDPVFAQVEAQCTDLRWAA